MHIQVEDLPDNFSLLLVDDQLTGLFGVSQNLGVAVHLAFLDTLLKDQLCSLSCTLGFHFSTNGHKLKHQLVAFSKGIQVFFHKPDHHTVVFQLILVHKALLDIACKPGNILYDDHVEHSTLGICHHLLEPTSQRHFSAGHTFIGVGSPIGPVWIALDHAAVGFQLILETLFLLYAAGGNAHIVHNSQLHVGNQLAVVHSLDQV